MRVWIRFGKGVVDNIGGRLYQIGRLAPLFQLNKETLKIFHCPHFKTNSCRPISAPPLPPTTTKSFSLPLLQLFLKYLILPPHPSSRGAGRGVQTMRDFVIFSDFNQTLTESFSNHKTNLQK